MRTDEVQFYLRHRGQITAWAKLEKRVDALMRDAVKQGAVDKAIQLLKGDSGDKDVDFYVRNRSLITQWDGLQSAAGQALHNALQSAAQDAGAAADTGKRGHSSAHFPTEHLTGRLWVWDDHGVRVQLWWIRQHLMSTRRQYAFPRLFLSLNRHRWKGERGDAWQRPPGRPRTNSA